MLQHESQCSPRVGTVYVRTCCRFPPFPGRLPPANSMASSSSMASIAFKTFLLSCPLQVAHFRPCSSRALPLGPIHAHRSGGDMDDGSTGELPDVAEPALKKQALENGHSNGNDLKLVVARSLALRVKKLAPQAVLPSRGSALAAGYDLSSAYDSSVPARGKALIKTELSVAIPEATYGRVAPRSGLAWKHSIDVGAGVIDADYRGPLGVILFNHSDVDFVVKAGDRIAQLILERIETPQVLEVEDLDCTARGEGGFGSTGVAIAPQHLSYRSSPMACRATETPHLLCRKLCRSSSNALDR